MRPYEGYQLVPGVSKNSSQICIGLEQGLVIWQDMLTALLVWWNRIQIREERVWGEDASVLRIGWRRILRH